MKITFLTVMPSPYVQDLFAALNDDPRIDLRVLYMEQEAPDTHWGEQEMPSYAKVLPGRWIGFHGARIHINPTVRRELANHPADLVVVVGYVGITNQIAMRYLSRRNLPWVFWGEIPGFQSRGWFGSKLRSIAQRAMKSASGIAAVGSHAVRSYSEIVTKLKCSDIPIHNIPYHCNMSDYIEAAKTRKPSNSTNSAPIRFLYCGQLIKRKGVDLLIEAFTRLAEQEKDVRLTLAGEGPLHECLKASLPRDVAEKVTFLGFRPVNDLPEIFAESDIFILPSRHDGWGVVVNQAIAAGMPVIATDQVGAANDLVIPNENGFRIPAESSTAIYEAMNHFACHPESITKYAERSQQIAEIVSMDSAVNDWHCFFKSALDWHRKNRELS
ncbi:MAG: glycosyltransferase family 4 protein [Planctomycetaceae bacterium]|nr:glycosyltransferase family 4 protein [Planctomycetaceae bacterium]